MILAFGLLPIGVAAQDNRDIAGSYSGEIGAKQATLHLRVRPDGALTATLDNLDLSAPWMFTCADVHREGSTLTFAVPSVQASFRGDFAAGAKEIRGTWTQRSNSLLITFTRETFVPAQNLLRWTESGSAHSQSETTHRRGFRSSSGAIGTAANIALWMHLTSTTRTWSAPMSLSRATMFPLMCRLPESIGAANFNPKETYSPATSMED